MSSAATATNKALDLILPYDISNIFTIQLVSND